ncbi:hypothetical protein [Micromonospora yangpuensis]|uniref:Polyhydroxyalkanoate synthesis regulator phasin n=1 Tax=Micromonospora yangpuensis TaxID=683228 RepID=A0A1C6UJ92_9ACTN|nr:hypothetical protein [Micromonospora yangpuensis]GGM30541.1 hypothetical protein GCM10012279_56870 [Micromonospora yangpuensis]SCL54117.1 Polyhydroxyalkanoate synthesis regulator phasin [Micromonospora yangpuensis]
MQDAWRAYLELAMGLTEAPRKRAQDVVRRVVGSGGATAGQLQVLAEELVSTGMANREALTKLVRFEVDRALGAVGLATADEVAELTRRVHELEQQLRQARAGSPLPATSASAASASAEPAADGGAAIRAMAAAPAGPPMTNRAVAKKTVAKKPVVEPADAGQPATEPAVARRPVAKKAVARKATTKAVVRKDPAASTPVPHPDDVTGPARPTPGRTPPPGGAA